MKIRCKCGALILDSTDYINNKGYVVPDQDLEDFENEVGKVEEEDLLETILKYSKTIYQCYECSRLILELNNEYHFFSADDPDKSESALRSVFGEKWKGCLRGNWFDNKGTILWDGAIEDEIFDFNMRDWDELSKRYFEAFEKLKHLEILRDSFLRKDGEMLHQWPYRT
jgi:hypothetical protein